MNADTFLSRFHKKSLWNKFVKTTFVQDNESKSRYGVVRGLHFQKPPFSQSKLVRVVVGKVLDVAVDIRKGSPTFGKHVAVELSAEDKRQLFVPRGFAHGFAVLSEEVIFQYKCDNYYNPKEEGSVLWNDPALQIDWKIPHQNIILSQKDKESPLLKDAFHFDFDVNLYE
ncbi:dTDP-L-rhamnose synthetase [Capnocytophaga canimorsus]|uniref:dTDP-4-dehydrorhamnose 3,5-epimerase n=1 Tax=Capnocytophaga canimorsus TaxID=28188 RepID=A0A0B7I888_9FLAO|nr:dTDP-L-rhamnose synthetase [Capnocytophaga canimorsus]